MKRTILNECMRIARTKNYGWDARMKSHHFCFIVQANKIVEYGTNVIAPPLKNRGYKSFQMVHAENIAYKRAKGILDKGDEFEAVNIRLNSNDELKLSKPCSCCYNFLKAAGCVRVWFSTELGFAKIVL